MMNKNAKLSLLAIGFIFTLSSCTKEEAVVPEEDGPSVSLEFSRNSQKLYNEVMLTFIVTDNEDIEKVTFFLDEQLLGEKTEAPYKILWNTREVEDGSYRIKAVVYDSQGNKREEWQEVKVRNTLLTVHVADDYLENNESRKMDHWIFLSDKKGAIIGELQQLTNGAILKWDRPLDVDSDTIYFTQVEYEGKFTPPLPPIEYLRVNTYSNFLIDEFHFEKPDFPTWPVLTNWAYAVVENDFDGVEIYQYSKATPYIQNRQNSAAKTVRLGEIRLNGSSGKVLNCYTRYYDQAGKREKHYRFDEVFSGNSYKFHTREYTAMKEVILPVAFEYSFLMYEVKGYLSPKDELGFRLDYNEIPRENNKTGNAKFFYADEFPEIFTTISAATESNKRVWNTIKGLPPKGYTLPDFSSSVNQSDTKHIQVTTQGTFDIGSLSRKYKGKEVAGTFDNTRTFHFNSQSGVTYVIPEIPASLFELYPELNLPLESSNIHMVDIKSLETYEDNVKYGLSKSFYKTEREEFSAINIQELNEGGRIKAGQASLAEGDQFEKERLRAMRIFH